MSWRGNMASPACRSGRAKQKRSRDRADRRASIGFTLVTRRGDKKVSSSWGSLQYANDRNCRVAVTKLSQMGDVEAGTHATQAINALNPSCVLMVGIAAGVNSEIGLGDVIVSTQVISVSLPLFWPSPLPLLIDPVCQHSRRLRINKQRNL